MKIYRYIFVVLAFFSFDAFAWSQMDKIVEIKVAHGNQTLIRFQNANYHSCGGSQFFIISEGDSVSVARRQMLALALTALSSGKSVWIVTGGSDSDAPQCNATGYEWVYQISIYP